ncbi:MAG: hypothetical protein L0Z62_30935 [Gemmataceae bacterium]|nr:hypothetical protein [Gemmataceae bacterium]
MRTSGGIATLGAVLVLGVTGIWSMAAPTTQAEHIATLVMQLGSAKYLEREAATQALDEIGAPALPALRSAIRHEDAEIRRRAEELVRNIERRLEASKLLEPRRLRLVYKDTPIPEAVRDLAKRTGYPIQLQTDPVTFAKRKITLETADLPFWEAFDQFCQQAGLVERDLLTGPRPSVQIADGAGRVVQRAYDMPGSLDTRWVLVEGKAPVVPGCRSLAVRVLALPSTATARNRALAAGEYALTLDVCPEAKLLWQSILEVRVERAVDEQDQPLSQVGPTPGYSGDGVRHWDGATSLPLTSPRRIQIPFRSGALPSKMLKEVSGTIAAEVQTPRQPLLTVENVLQTAGQTFRGAAGESLKVSDILHQPGGLVRLRVEIEQPLPAPALWGRGALIRGNRVIAMNGRVRGVMLRDFNVGGPPNLTLLDAAGQEVPLQVTDSEVTAGGNGMTQRLLVGFRRAEGQPEATKLILHGRRSLLLEVPFTLRDVPLQ